MKNFNNDDIDKYESMSKRALSKYIKSPSFRIPQFRMKTIFKYCSIAGFIYLGYRVYQFHRLQREQYIDFFEVKKNISSQTKRADLLSKIQSLSFGDKQLATKVFEEKLKQSFPKFLDQIKEKKNYSTQQQDVPRHRQRKKKKKSENKNRVAHAEIVLSKSQSCKMDLGYLLKLHSKTNISTISNASEYLKKSYMAPIVLFDVPFWGKKKQAVKKIKNKEKLSQTISSKQHFEFSSQCERINYWNLKYIELFRRNRGDKKQNKQNSTKMQADNKQIPALRSMQLKQNPAVSNVQNQKNDESDRSNQRKQLLFQCRKRIKTVEQEFIKQLKKAVSEHWESKGSNTEDYNKYQFKLTSWEQQKQN